LDETAGTVFDSTVNGNDGAPQNDIVQDVSGWVDGADHFYSSGDDVNKLIKKVKKEHPKKTPFITKIRDTLSIL